MAGALVGAAVIGLVCWNSRYVGEWTGVLLGGIAGAIFGFFTGAVGGAVGGGIGRAVGKVAIGALTGGAAAGLAAGLIPVLVLIFLNLKDGVRTTTGELYGMVGLGLVLGVGGLICGMMAGCLAALLGQRADKRRVAAFHFSSST